MSKKFDPTKALPEELWEGTRPWWRRYSAHGEFPLSSATSLVSGLITTSGWNRYDPSLLSAATSR